MFSLFRQKWTAYSYKRNDLNIIEKIRAETFNAIIEHYRSQGWEQTDAFRPFDAENQKWTCKLRKGSQTLYCVWRYQSGGSISGMPRIMQSMGAQYSLKVCQAPSKG